MQVHSSQFLQTACQVLQLKSRVATYRQLHTGEFQQRSAMHFCYHQNLPNVKRMTILGLPCDTSGGASQYSTCVFWYECSTSRSSEFCTSGERDTWLELSLKKGPRSANSCSSNWSPGLRGKVPPILVVRNHHCD